MEAHVSKSTNINTVSQIRTTSAFDLPPQRGCAVASATRLARATKRTNAGIVRASETAAARLPTPCALSTGLHSSVSSRADTDASGAGSPPTMRTAVRIASAISSSDALGATYTGSHTAMPVPMNETPTRSRASGATGASSKRQYSSGMLTRRCPCSDAIVTGLGKPSVTDSSVFFRSPRRASRCSGRTGLQPGTLRPQRR
jgi:hypothetical protein